LLVELAPNIDANLADWLDRDRLKAEVAVPSLAPVYEFTAQSARGSNL
jgi:hypothetical protein